MLIKIQPTKHEQLLLKIFKSFYLLHIIHPTNLHAMCYLVLDKVFFIFSLMGVYPFSQKHKTINISSIKVIFLGFTFIIMNYILVVGFIRNWDEIKFFANLPLFAFLIYAAGVLFSIPIIYCINSFIFLINFKQNYEIIQYLISLQQQIENNFNIKFHYKKLQIFLWLSLIILLITPVALAIKTFEINFAVASFYEYSFNHLSMIYLLTIPWCIKLIIIELNMQIDQYLIEIEKSKYNDNNSNFNKLKLFTKLFGDICKLKNLYSSTFGLILVLNIAYDTAFIIIHVSIMAGALLEEENRNFVFIGLFLAVLSLVVFNYLKILMLAYLWESCKNGLQMFKYKIRKYTLSDLRNTKLRCQV